MDTLEKAKRCVDFLLERKAVDPVLFDVGQLTSLTDYFLIASGNSTRQVQSMSRHLQRRMRESGFRPYGVEGEQEGQWILLDFGDLVVHLFYEPVREFYDLEGLWVEAPRIPIEGEEPVAGPE